MKTRILKSAYDRLTFKCNDKSTDGNLVISNLNGIVRISNVNSKTNNSAVSPISLNRTIRRNIKKIPVAK